MPWRPNVSGHCVAVLDTPTPLYVRLVVLVTHAPISETPPGFQD
jgi:hypothetical protein